MEKVSALQQATQDILSKNVGNYAKQMGEAVNALRAEMRLSTGEARENAASALKELKQYQKLRGLQKQTTLTAEQATQLLKGLERSRALITEVSRKNARLKNADGTQVKGSDGKTLTERLRAEGKDITTKEQIVDLLKAIAERKESINDSKRDEHRNIKDTFRQGLSAFLGPAGPLIETFASLKEAYGDDAKKMLKSLGKWWKGDQDVLKEIEKESGRNERRDKKLFGMLSDKFRKFSGLLGSNGKGVLDRIGDFFGWGGKTGRGKGGALGKIGGKIAGGFGKIAGKGLGLAGRTLGRLLPGVGIGIGAYGLSQLEEAKESDTMLDKASAYGGAALDGASVGAGIGSVVPVVGTVVGAVVGALGGVIYAGFKRNWSTVEKAATTSWDTVKTTFLGLVDGAKSFGLAFLDLPNKLVEVLTSGVQKVYTWLKANIPGFEKLMEWGSKAGAAAVDAGKGAIAWAGDKASSAGSAIADAAQKTASVASEKAQQFGAAVNEAATDTKIAVAGAVEKTSQKVADKAAEIAYSNEGKGGVAGSIGAAASTVNKSAQGVADFAGAVGGKAILERQMTASGITDPKERAMMLAQIDHESGFKARSENLNYSSVDRLNKTFNGKNAAFSKLSDAEKAKLVNNPEALANVVYGNRMGNKEAGDGYTYRGRGMIQLTGKANYEKYGKLLGIDLVKNPELANDPKIAAQIATAYWKENKLGEAARKGDIKSVTQTINGGQNGAADREAKYAKYLKEGDTQVAIAPKADTAGTTMASVAPTTESFQRVESVTPDANVTLAQNNSTNGNTANSNGSVENRQIAATDVPFVLGDNHMVVINAGMMGA